MSEKWSDDMERMRLERDDAYNRADYNREMWEKERSLREEYLARALKAEARVKALEEQAQVVRTLTSWATQFPEAWHLKRIAAAVRER